MDAVYWRRAGRTKSPTHPNRVFWCCACLVTLKTPNDELEWISGRDRRLTRSASEDEQRNRPASRVFLVELSSAREMTPRYSWAYKGLAGSLGAGLGLVVAATASFL